MTNTKFLLILLAAIGTTYFLTKPKKGHILEGGMGDSLSEEDVDPEQFKMGLKVESEHTKDKDIATEIVLDHLAEDPKYYTKLATIEKNPKKKKKKSKK